MSKRVRGDINAHVYRRPVARAVHKPPPRPRDTTAVAAAQRRDGLSIVGDMAMWNGLLEIVASTPTPPVVVLHGPPGTGKTFGVGELARVCNRRLVLVDGTHLVASDSNVATFEGELRVACTRTGVVAETTVSRALPLLVVDDADHVPQPLIKPLVAFLRAPPTARGPVVLVCGRDVPVWIPRDSARFFSTSPFTPAMLRELIRPARVPPDFVRPTDTAIRAYATECQGDARAFLNLVRCGGDAPEAAVNEWSAVRKLVYHSSTIDAAAVDRIAQTTRAPLLASLLHANYVQAVSRVSPSVRPSAEDAVHVMDAVAARASMWCDADCMRDRTMAKTDAGTFLSLVVACGTGFKGASTHVEVHSGEGPKKVARRSNFRADFFSVLHNADYDACKQERGK